MLAFNPTVSGYNMLGVFAGPSRSHNEIGLKLFEKLASQGHNVTFVTSLKLREIPANFEYIKIAETKKMSEASK